MKAAQLKNIRTAQRHLTELGGLPYDTPPFPTEVIEWLRTAPEANTVFREVFTKVSIDSMSKVVTGETVPSDCFSSRLREELERRIKKVKKKNAEDMKSFKAFKARITPHLDTEAEHEMYLCFEKMKENISIEHMVCGEGDLIGRNDYWTLCYDWLKEECLKRGIATSANY